MLNKKLKQKVIDALSSKNFTVDDFHINFEDYSAVGIEFKHEGNYHFYVQENIRYHTESITSSRSSKFALVTLLNQPSPEKETREIEKIQSKYDFVVAPGKELAIETWKSTSLSNISENIHRWLEYLEAELSTTPEDIAKDSPQKQKFKDIFTSNLEPYIDDKEARFNSHDIVEISNKMEELVNSIEETKTLVKEEIEELRKVVEQINQNLGKYKKGTWLETASNLMSQWVSSIKNLDALIGAIDKISDTISSISSSSPSS